MTGTAGFIGAALALRLLERGDEVVGVDNLDPSCDVSLKRARLDRVRAFAGFHDIRGDIADRKAMAALFARERPSAVVHLAARPGVRACAESPEECVDANLAGFANVLEGCRRNGVGHLVYASSSAVYGAGTALPFPEDAAADRPLSLYAATKRSNELMAHGYGAFHGLRTTGLRLASVYGPWGRPDMALFRFTRSILEDRAVELYNGGRHSRDFTWIDDAVEGVVRILDACDASGATARGRDGGRAGRGARTSTGCSTRIPRSRRPRSRRGTTTVRRGASSAPGAGSEGPARSCSTWPTPPGPIRGSRG